VCARSVDAKNSSFYCVRSSYFVGFPNMIAVFQRAFVSSTCCARPPTLTRRSAGFRVDWQSTLTQIYT
jgi:hypothetical protein